jgi:hypothetical protein
LFFIFWELAQLGVIATTVGPETIRVSRTITTMDAVKNVASDALGLAKNAPKEIKRGTEETHSEAHQVGWPPPLSHLQQR